MNTYESAALYAILVLLIVSICYHFYWMRKKCTVHCEGFSTCPSAAGDRAAQEEGQREPMCVGCVA